MKLFQKKPKLNRRKLIIAAILIGVVAVSFIIRGSNAPEEIEEVVKKQIRVQEISKQGEVTSTLSVSGTITPRQYTAIRSLVQGTLEFVHPAGSEVTVGQPLFNIRDDNIENNYLNALQSMQQSNLIADDRVSQAALSVNTAEAQYELAKKNVAVAEQQADQASFNINESAKSSYSSAYNTLSQFFAFIAVGDPVDFNFVYKELETPKYQLRNDTNAQYIKSAKLFDGLATTADANNLETSLAEMNTMLVEAKTLVNQIFLLLNDSRIANYAGYASDRVIVSGYQTQINAFRDSVLGAQNGLINTKISNDLNVDSAQSALSVAEIQLNNTEIGLNNAQISASLEKTISQTQLDSAAYHFGNLSLTSPFSGTILRTFAEAGQQVSIGQEILEVGNIEIVEVEVEVDTEFGAGLKQGDKVSINGLYEGFISEVEPVGSIVSGKIGVTVQSENSNGFLTPGEIADVEFKLTFEQPDLIIIPIKSATIEPASTYVFVVEDGKAIKRNITLGRVFGSKVTVTDGLIEGDKLIIKNGVFISEGNEVEIVE